MRTFLGHQLNYLVYLKRNLISVTLYDYFQLHLCSHIIPFLFSMFVLTNSMKACYYINVQRAFK